MTQTLEIPSSFHEVLGLAASQAHLFWLAQVTSSIDSGVTDQDGSNRVLRMTSNGVAIPFDTNPASGQPLIWQAWPMSFDSIPATADGSVEGVRLSFGNVGGYAARLYDLNDRFLDHVVRLRLVHSDLLADPTASVTFKLRVVSSQIDLQRVSLECSSHNFQGINFPLDLVTRQCRFPYRSAACGFTQEFDPENTLGQCPKTLAACKRRGQWAVDNGLAASVNLSNWPKRFGGFPALPSGPFAI